MAKDKKQKLNTAYQRHLDLLKAFGIILIGIALLIGVIIVNLLNANQYTEGTTAFENLFRLFVTALIFLAAGIVVSVIASFKQNKADAINHRLYAIWKYKPQTVYRFERKLCRHKKKTVFFEFTAGAAAALIIGLILIGREEGHSIGIIFFIGAALLFLLGVIALPYVQYLLLKLRTLIMGDAKEIIFSRSGIWYCGKVCYFGEKGITYHRVERKEIYGQDAIIFYYTRTRGFQQTAKELIIPVAQKMSYAVDDLLQEFNRSDLLETETESIFKKK